MELNKILFKQNSNIKQVFSDPFDFTLSYHSGTRKLILNDEMNHNTKEIETKLRKDVKFDEETFFNDIEIENTLFNFFDENSEFLGDYTEKIDLEKIREETEKLEKRLLSQNLILSHEFQDKFEKKHETLIKKNKLSLQKFEKTFYQSLQPKLPNFANFDAFITSLNIDISKREGYVMEQKKSLEFLFDPTTQSQTQKSYKTNLFKSSEKSLKEIEDFLSSVKLAKTYPFELDEFQKRAIYFIENDQNVFVAAHTSAGKTVVAEYAIAKALKNNSKVVFTSPIKALSNQKYYEFSDKFKKDGDIVLNQEANCLIMTTEILRNKLFKKCDSLENIEWVIFDEVHYINDEERGSVWEETIILLPQNVGIVMLSATVENVEEFADWVTRTTEKKLNVLKTFQRPVPLKHFIYYGKAHLIKEHNKNMDEEAYREILRKIEVERKKKKFKKDQKWREVMDKKKSLMEKSNQRERVRKITREKTNKNKFLYQNELKKLPLKEDKNVC